MGEGGRARDGVQGGLECEKKEIEMVVEGLGWL